jgi:hypothetical protein
MKNQSNKILVEMFAIIIIYAMIGFLIIYISLKMVGVEATLLGFWIAILSLLFLALLNGEVKI